MNDRKSFYQDGLIYDAMNDSLVSDTHFYLEEFKNVSGKILELACGTGRITCALAQAGRSLTGLDMSKQMLAQARQKSAALDLNINWHLGDMTQFQLDQKFDVIFVGYNSVHHILTNKDFQTFLTHVKNHLLPDGKFYFDIFNPSLAVLMRAGVRSDVEDFIHPVSGERIFVTEDNFYDAATQINHVRYYYSKSEESDFYTHPLDMRCYFPQEMDALLAYNGFNIVNKYGNFKKNVFASDSMKQIFECAVI